MQVKRKQIISFLVVITLLFSTNITLLTCAAEEFEAIMEEMEEVIEEFVEEVFDDECIEEEELAEEIVQEDILEPTEEVMDADAEPGDGAQEETASEAIQETPGASTDDEVSSTGDTDGAETTTDASEDNILESTDDEADKAPTSETGGTASEAEDKDGEVAEDVIEKDNTVAEDSYTSCDEATEKVTKENEGMEVTEKDPDKAEELLPVNLSLVETAVVEQAVYTTRGYVYLEVDKKSTSAGSYVSVDITLSENINGIAGMIITVNYSNEMVLTSVTKGGALSSLELTPFLDGNSAMLIWDGFITDYSEGVIATLNFRVNSDAISGLKYVDLSYVEGDVFDQNMQDLDVVIKHGCIFVTAVDQPTVRPTVQPGEVAVGTVYDGGFDAEGKNVVSVYISEEESGLKTVMIGASTLYYNEQTDRYVGLVTSTYVTSDSLKAVKILDSASETFVYGNVDGDDEYDSIDEAVDATDLQVLKKFVKGQSNLSVKQLISSDLDGDGYADAADLQTLKKYLKSDGTMVFLVLK